MRLPALFGLLGAATVLAAPTPARADSAPNMRVAASASEPAFRVMQDGERLRFGKCIDADCTLSPTTSQSTQLPKDTSEVVLQELRLAGGRRVVVAKTESPAGTWAAVLSPGADAPVFAGPIGPRTDAEGRRFGTALEWEQRPEGARIVRGSLDPALEICGSSNTPLAPELYNPESHNWNQVALQRLQPARIAAGKPGVFRAAPTAAARGLSLRLLETPQASDRGSASELLDGNPATGWSERRSGAGVGEFVTFGVIGSAIDGIRIMLPQAQPAEAMPASLLITTAGDVFRVHIPRELAIPGAEIEFQFPERQLSGCVSMVLDQIQDPKANAPVVGFAEVSAIEHYANYREFREDYVQNGERFGDLPRALPIAAQRTMAGELATLPPKVLAHLITLTFETASCREFGPILGALVSSADSAIRTRARAKLERCRAGGEPALTFALEGPARAYAASQLGISYPSAALEALPAALGVGSAEDRSAVRTALLRVLSRRDVADRTALLHSLKVESRAGRIDRVRTLAQLPAFQDAALCTEIAALLETANFDERYYLASPLGELAGRSNTAADLFAARFAAEEAPIRVRMLHAAPAQMALEPVAIAALRDPNARVRAQAALYLQNANTSAAAAQTASKRKELEARLTGDPFSFVQQEAGSALALMSPAPSTTAAFLKALRDPVRSVRIAAITGLAKLPSAEVRPAIRASFLNEEESSEVRAQAATTLGAMCMEDDHSDLLEAALVLRDAYANEGQVRLGLAALSALGARAKSGLAKDLEPLFGRGIRQPVRAAATAAVATTRRCPAAAK